MEEDSIKTQDETFAKNAKLYFGSLMPFDNNTLKKVWNEYSKYIDISKDQVFVSREDIHRELFVTLLSLVAKVKGRKASFNKTTLNQLVDASFSTDKKRVPKHLEGDILFIVHSVPTRENKIFGPVLDQIVEDRKTYGKRTYVFYKGIASQFKGLKSLSLTNIVDLNTDTVVNITSNNDTPVTNTIVHNKEELL